MASKDIDDFAALAKKHSGPQVPICRTCGLPNNGREVVDAILLMRANGARITYPAIALSIKERYGVELTGSAVANHDRQHRRGQDAKKKGK